MVNAKPGKGSRHLFALRFKDCLPNGFNDLLLAALDEFGAWLERRKTSATCSKQRYSKLETRQVRDKRAATI